VIAPKVIKLADLFCGAGGTSSGAVEAIAALGYRAELTAINHWDVAIATHSTNHPDARHLCTAVDDVNPRSLYREGELDLLWASPECTHHSTARAGRPINEQSRATAHCVTRWAEALRPPAILVENVPAFSTWGPIGTNNRPLKSRKGETFQAWLHLLRALGYTVDYRVLCAADYGDPTTRERLFVQAVRGRRRIVWPDATHAANTEADLFGPSDRKPWVPVRDVIDWSIPIHSINGRKRPLAENTLQRIEEGLREYGGAAIIAMEHGGRALPLTAPLPTITCAKGGAFGIAYILPQQSGGKLRPVSEPAPTIATSGALALIVEYYGKGVVRPVTEPLPTITTVDRFGLIVANGGDVLFRMLRPKELAAAMSFRPTFKFTGNYKAVTKQIGNAVPRRMARALCAAVLSQRSDVRDLLEDKEAA
jgi:DNA (cytosine-5)-methyltransferase 1